jgi:hypothetical protein
MQQNLIGQHNAVQWVTAALQDKDCRCMHSAQVLQLLPTNTAVPYLWVCWPLAVLLEPLPHNFVAEDVKTSK